MPDPKKHIESSSKNLPAIIIAMLIWLSSLLPLISPDLNLWSVNHLIFLSPWHLVVYIVCGLATLIIMLPRPGVRISELFDKGAESLMSRSAGIKWLITALLFMPLFWLFRMPTHFLGDGYEVIGNVCGENPAIYKWAETGAIWIVYQLGTVLPFSGKARGEYAYAIVSTVSGAITVFLFLALAYETGKKVCERLSIFLLLIFSGWILLFFGYSENYPILWPFMTAYIYFSIRYINGKDSLIPPTFFIVAAVLLHLQSLFFLLSYPYLLLVRGRGLRFFRNYRGLVFLSAVVAAIAGGIVFYLLYQQSMAFQLNFLPLIEGRPADPGYALLSISHLMDILNESFLLIPLWPALLVLSRFWRRRPERDGTDWFLIWFSLGGLAFLLILDPKLGMARDWDLFALAGLGPLILLTRNALKSDGSASRAGLMPGLILLAAVLVFPFIAVNVVQRPSLEYYSWILRHEVQRSEHGMIRLRNYYNKYGEFNRADSLNREAHRLFPRIDMSQRAYDLMQSGRFNESMAIADRLIKENPYIGEGYYLRGMIFLNSGKFERAIKDFEVVRDLSPYDHLVYVNLSIAYERTGRPDLMMKNLRTAQKLKPDDIFVLQALAMLFLNQDEADSSLVYARQLLAVNATNLTGLLTTGVSSFMRGQKDEARRYLTRYLEIAPPGPERDRIEEIMRNIESGP